MRKPEPDNPCILIVILSRQRFGNVAGHQRFTRTRRGFQQDASVVRGNRQSIMWLIYLTQLAFSKAVNL